MKTEKKRIYADNAATARMSKRAIEAMLPFMDSLYGNPSGICTEARVAAEALNDAREDRSKAWLYGKRDHLYVRRKRSR